MNELKKRLTKFFYEATRVKSYIDFSGENYQKAKDSELSSGRINSLATNEFWVENKPSDTKKDKLEVILIPKVLADGLIDLGVDVRVPFGILYVPARLDKDGTLFPPDSIYKTPWIPRDVLTPFHMQEKAIGAWSEYPQKHFLKENYQNWDNYWEAVRSFYEKALCVSWGETEIENKKSEKGELLALDEESYFILDQTVDAKFHIRSLYKKILAGKNLSLSLYDKMLTGEQETQEAPYQAHSLRCMYQHSGQMGGEYPLSESQREAVNHFHFLKDGDVLAVSGPPGTGKTTLETKSPNIQAMRIRAKWTGGILLSLHAGILYSIISYSAIRQLLSINIGFMPTHIPTASIQILPHTRLPPINILLTTAPVFRTGVIRWTLTTTPHPHIALSLVRNICITAFGRKS